MKRKNLKFGMYFLLAMIFLTGSDAFSQRGNRFFNRGINNNMLVGRNYQSLSDEQNEKIISIREECFIEQEKTQTLLLEKHIELQNLMAADNTDEKVIDNVIDEISALQSKITKAQLKTNRKLKKVLTKEQLELWDNGLGAGMGFGFGAGMGSGFGNRAGIGRAYGNVNGFNAGVGFGRGAGRGMGRGVNCLYYNNSLNALPLGRGINSGINSNFNNGRLNRNRMINDGRLHRNRWW